MGHLALGRVFCRRWPDPSDACRVDGNLWTTRMGRGVRVGHRAHLNDERFRVAHCQLFAHLINALRPFFDEVVIAENGANPGKERWRRCRHKQRGESAMVTTELVGDRKRLTSASSAHRWQQDFFFHRDVLQQAGAKLRVVPIGNFLPIRFCPSQQLSEPRMIIGQKTEQWSPVHDRVSFKSPLRWALNRRLQSFRNPSRPRCAVAPECAESRSAARCLRPPRAPYLLFAHPRDPCKVHSCPRL